MSEKSGKESKSFYRFSFCGSPSSANSQARASLQSRFTVSEETFNTSAVSSTLNPAKKRSSMTRAFRGSGGSKQRA